ncbi:hypothetical protein SASPL_151485 [Salvia splendens]|uniref:EF-hand domain-containing protein n=1 Tax=Salvia splendens TaxID=180675 RepID=A0A8X8W831_SALSN|nr:hypothetical protein SASPL_151485 [Salvia splendens]
MITFISLILSHLFHHPRPDFSQKSGRGPTTKSVAARITGNDVGVVMRRLRLPHHEPFSQDSVENIEGIFEGAEPVLEEVREAFRTFDENDDGFVDAEELEKDSDAVNSNSDVFNGNSCPSDCESGVSGAENKIGNSICLLVRWRARVQPQVFQVNGNVKQPAGKYIEQLVNYNMLTEKCVEHALTWSILRI